MVSSVYVFRQCFIPRFVYLNFTPPFNLLICKHLPQISWRRLTIVSTSPSRNNYICYLHYQSLHPAILWLYFYFQLVYMYQFMFSSPISSWKSHNIRIFVDRVLLRSLVLSCLDRCLLKRYSYNPFICYI